MKKIALIFIIIGMNWGACVNDQSLTLIQSGQSRYQIIIGQNASAIE